MEAIQDHGLIGNCRAAALVSKRGTIDWLCWPRFDSPAVFGALLDDRAGHWSLRPKAPFVSRQRYVEGTNVLETRFEVDGGVVVVTDLMPVVSEEEKDRLPMAEHEILRVVRCERGVVEIETELRARPNYGLRPARLRDERKIGIRIAIDEGVMLLRGDLPLSIVEGVVRGSVTLRAGEAAHLSLVFASEGPAILPPLGAWSRE